jgi:hypothetical protein
VDHDNIYTQMQTPDSGGGGAFWKNVQWGKLPNADGKTYPGTNSMGPDHARGPFFVAVTARPELQSGCGVSTSSALSICR